MHCTVAEAQARTTSVAFTEWLAFQRIEPGGYEWEKWRLGVLASSIVNAIYSTIPVPKGKPRPKSLKPQDFYPSFKKSQPDLTPEQAEYIRKKHGKRRHSNR